VDPILDKIAAHGIKLTASERETLDAPETNGEA